MDGKVFLCIYETNTKTSYHLGRKVHYSFVIKFRSDIEKLKEPFFYFLIPLPYEKVYPNIDNILFIYFENFVTRQSSIDV